MVLSKSKTARSETGHQQPILTVTEVNFLLSHNPNSIIITDCNGYIEYVNANFTSSTGYTEEDVFCRHFENLRLYQHPEAIKDAWQTVLDGAVWEGETVSNRKNGTRFFERIFLMPIYSNEVDVYAIAFINRDISARKKIEHELLELTDTLELRVHERTAQLHNINKDMMNTIDQLEKTQDQLIESEKMASLGNLVGGIAHEINTPIGIAYTASTHLEKETSDFAGLYKKGQMKRKELEEYMETALETTHLLNSNLNRASELVRSFKQVAIDQSVELKRRFLLQPYLEEILLSLRPLLKKTAITTSINCHKDIKLNSYPGVFSQIITNLITNSLHHAYGPKSSGAIEITCRILRNSLILSYSDDGSGMDTETTDKIFTPFFTTNRENGGNGLGMHIVYNLVTQKLNGTIICSSKPGRGTIFTITIPLPDH